MQKLKEKLAKLDSPTARELLSVADVFVKRACGSSAGTAGL